MVYILKIIRNNKSNCVIGLACLNAIEPKSFGKQNRQAKAIERLCTMYSDKNYGSEVNMGYT